MSINLTLMNATVHSYIQCYLHSMYTLGTEVPISALHSAYFAPYVRALFN